MGLHPETPTIHRRDLFFDQLKHRVLRISSSDFSRIDQITSQTDTENNLQNSFPTIAFTDITDQSNFPTNLKVYINGDIVPEKFQKYFVEHECWETFLWFNAADGMYQQAIADSQQPELQQQRLFHRIAILNELKAASRDNQLAPYTEWVRQYYTGVLDRDDLPPKRRLILQSMWEMRQEMTAKFFTTLSRGHVSQE